MAKCQIHTVKNLCFFVIFSPKYSHKILLKKKSEIFFQKPITQLATRSLKVQLATRNSQFQLTQLATRTNSQFKSSTRNSQFQLSTRNSQFTNPQPIQCQGRVNSFWALIMTKWPKNSRHFPWFLGKMNVCIVFDIVETSPRSLGFSAIFWSFSDIAWHWTC